MIPVPTPALLKQIAANENNVYASYRRLIDAALAKQATRGDSYQRLVVQWSKLNLVPPGEAKEGTARRRAAELPQFVTDLNQLLAPAATQAQQPAEDFPPVAGSPWITRLLKLVEEKVVRPIETGSPRAMASMRTCFGDEAAGAAVPRFREILQQLQAIHARSDGKNKGMLYNPALPRSMGALGRGSGAAACIDLCSEFRPHLMSDVKAASTLVHEGSHTLAVEPTVDFAYRDAHAHYLLPPKLALLNAGNYEQVVIDLIGGMPGQLNAGEVQALRDGAGDSLAQVHALMCSRVVRAWVRVYDLIGLAANGRITAEELRGLPPLPSDSALLTAVLRELFAQLETLMSAVNTYLVLRLGAQPGGGLNRAPEQRTKDDPGAHQRPATPDDTQPLTFESTPTATTVTVSFGWASKGTPDAIARNVLFELTDHMWQGKQAAFSGSEVAHVVQSIQLTDRPALRTMLEDYYASLSRKTKID